MKPTYEAFMSELNSELRLAATDPMWLVRIQTEVDRLHTQATIGELRDAEERLERMTRTRE